MLSIAIYNNKINYISSKRSRNNLLVTNYGTSIYDSLDNAINKSTKDILNKEKIKNESISYLIDSQLCTFNEIFCENEDSLNFHENLSGNNKLSSHIDSYYYPIGTRNDHYLGIHIDKSIKQRLLNMIEDSNCSFSSLGIGIFSSEILARHVFQAKALDDYLILRFITSNLIETLYINDGLLMSYGKYRISNGKIIAIKVIGDIENKKKIGYCLDRIILKKNKTTSIIQKVFIYQSQGQSPIVKDLLKSKNNTNLILLNLFNYSNSTEYQVTIPDSFKHLSYAELGNIFRGIYV